MYAKIVDGQVNKYPYSILELRKDNPQVSYPENPNEEVLNSLGIFSIVPENPPTYKQATQRCDRVLPTFQNGRWVETWQNVEGVNFAGVGSEYDETTGVFTHWHPAVKVLTDEEKEYLRANPPS